MRRWSSEFDGQTAVILVGEKGNSYITAKCSKWNIWNAILTS